MQHVISIIWNTILNKLHRLTVRYVQHSLGRPDACLRQSRLVIGQFGCSRLPPSDANFGKGEGPPLKVNVKIFQLGEIMRNFQIVMITLLCFESES